MKTQKEKEKNMKVKINWNSKIILLIIVGLLVIGATYKLTSSVSLSTLLSYEEKCLKHEEHNVTVCLFEGKSCCDYSKDREMGYCNYSFYCPNVCKEYGIISEENKQGKCEWYHLVRKGLE